MLDGRRMWGNEQIYNLVAEDGRVFHFAVDRLDAFLYQEEHVRDFLFPVNITDDLRRHAYGNCGAHLPHVDTLPDEAVEVPVIMIWLNGYTVLIDGVHRVIKADRLGHTWVPAFVVPERVWRHFLITGILFENDADFWNEQNALDGRYQAPNRTIQL